MSIRILLVDDHMLVRQGIRSLLKDHETIEIVGEAGDGEMALELICELKPDIVILDIELPGIDGIDTTSGIMAANPQTKILALSMHSEKRYVSEMLASGARGYLLKDEDIDELVNAIEAIMAGEIYLSSKLVDTVVKDYTRRISQTREPDITDLSKREREILRLIAEGNTTREISEILNLKYKTVDTHRQQIMKKLDLHNVVDLTKFAIREGLIEL